MTISKPKLLIVEDDESSKQYFSNIPEDQYDLRLVPTVKCFKDAHSENEFKQAIIHISTTSITEIDRSDFLRWIFTQRLLFRIVVDCVDILITGQNKRC